MKITDLPLYDLQNANHFRFLTEFSNLINQFDAGAPKYSQLFARFNKLLLQEGECLTILQKSSYHKQLVEAIRLRDNVLNELIDMVNNACRHDNQEIAVEGNRLKIMFDAYQNSEYKPNDDKTLVINNLIKDLENKFNPAMQKIGGANKVTELEANNMACTLYNGLVGNCNTEAKITDTKIAINDVYYDIATIIESLSKSNDDDVEVDTYKNLILHLNDIIKCYQNDIDKNLNMD